MATRRKSRKGGLARTSTRTIVVQAPRRGRARRAGRAIARGARRAAGGSLAALKEKQNVRQVALGGLGALAFGLLQRKVTLPGILGVPNSLTYGLGALGVGLLAKSDALVKVSTGPLFAGIHNIGLRGMGGEMVGGEFEEYAAGEIGAGDDSTVEGEFDEEVTAGDFDDL